VRPSRSHHRRLSRTIPARHCYPAAWLNQQQCRSQAYRRQFLPMLRGSRRWALARSGLPKSRRHPRCAQLRRSRPGTHVSALFHAHTTSHRDRKEILRTLVQRVIIDERSPEQLIVTVRWCDQIEDTVLRIRGDRYTQHRIAALAVEGKSVRDISIQLAQEGLFTSWGTAWTPNAVRMALHRAGRRVRSRWAARG